MSRKQDLERIQLQMAKFAPMQERAKRIQKELLAERQAKLYAALSEFVSDAQLDSCKKAEIVEIVRAHMQGQSHPLDSVTEKEKARQAAFQQQLAEAAGRAAGGRKKSQTATAENPSEIRPQEPAAVQSPSVPPQIPVQPQPEGGGVNV